MDRRTLLKTGTMGFLGLGLGVGPGGCATGSGRGSSLVLAPVRVSWDRVIRTTVGLRPHRPSGFVLRAERLDAKTLIHNYGHGGSGMSLSWGTGFLAAAADHGEATSAARLRCHHLCHGRPAQHDLEHVARWFYADVRARGHRSAHEGVGRSVPACGRDCVQAAPTPGRPEIRDLMDERLLDAGRAPGERFGTAGVCSEPATPPEPAAARVTDG